MISFKDYIQEKGKTSITSGRFVKKTEKNPSWCADLTEPLIVRGAVDMRWSDITHLSPFLIFENFANFARAEKLRVAEGTFKRGASFTGCLKLESLGKLEVVGLPHVLDATTGVVCSFRGCTNLKVATGTYPGCVSFSYSGIEEIKDLFISPDIQKPGEDGNAAFFSNCERLRVATGTYPGYVEFAGSGVTEIRDLHIIHPNGEGEATDLSGCDIQKISNFTYKGKIFAEPETKAKIQQLQGQEKAGGKGEFDDLF